MRLFEFKGPTGALWFAAAIYSPRDTCHLYVWVGKRSFRFLLNDNRPHDVARGAW